MPEYIEREVAEKVFSQPVTMSMCLTLEECKMKNAQRQIDLFVIRGLPAADVRPVVLCRDCAFFKPQQKSKRWSSTTPMCSRSATIKMPPDGFCSFGVKREER